jgi:hypothetical protein
MKAVDGPSAEPYSIPLATQGFFEAGAQLKCMGCKADCHARYFVINGNLTLCANCKADYINAKLGSSRWAFVRSWLFGTLAGIVGVAVMIGVFVFTGQLFGMLASLVGILVGKAVRSASRGRGGWVYETLAVFISYGCIVLPYAPLIFGLVYIAPRLESAAMRNQVETLVLESLTGVSAEDLAYTYDHPYQRAIGALQTRLESRPLAAALCSWVLAWAVPFLCLPYNMLTWAFFAVSMTAAWRLNLHPPCKVSVLGPLKLAA